MNEGLFRPFRKAINHFERVTQHDPATCTSPGHLKIRKNGVLFCGPGGYDSQTNDGYILLPSDHQIIYGKVIGVNPFDPSFERKR